MDKELRMKKTSKDETVELLDIVFSWTLKDVLNEYLYKDKVLLFHPFSSFNTHKKKCSLEKYLDC